MLKWISVALQLFALKNSFIKTTTAFEVVERSIETAQSYFAFAIGFMVASLFFLIALIVAIIGVGMQVEQGVFLSFSGLMVSATIFFAISFFFYFISTIALVIQKQKLAERRRLAEQARAAETGMPPIISEILKQILVNLSKPKEPKGPTGSAQERS